MEKPNLLLIEDSETDAHFAIRIFKKNLENANYKWIADGQSALDFFEDINREELPDMVLLDLKIPKVNGLEVLHKLKTNPRTAHLPIIVYSSSGQEEDIKQAYANGANSYLVKPNDYIKMKEDLGITFKYWIKKNRKPAIAV